MKLATRSERPTSIVRCASRLKDMQPQAVCWRFECRRKEGVRREAMAGIYVFEGEGRGVYSSYASARYSTAVYRSQGCLPLEGPKWRRDAGWRQRGGSGWRGARRPLPCPGAPAPVFTPAHVAVPRSWCSIAGQPPLPLVLHC